MFTTVITQHQLYVMDIKTIKGQEEFTPNKDGTALYSRRYSLYRGLIPYPLGSQLKNKKPHLEE